MPRKLNISVVVFDVEYEQGKGDITEEDAMRQVFAFSGALSFRRESNTSYQSGDYEQFGDRGPWVGKMVLQREMKPLQTARDRRRGVRFSEAEQAVTATESATIYAYDPVSHTVAFRERAWLPYTRLRSYVRRAALGTNPPLRLDLVPRKVARTIPKWIEQFDRLDTISFEFRHSQSPGNDAIDAIFEALNAEHIREVVAAPFGEGLNQDALIEGDTPQAALVDHLSKNPRNGTARMIGVVGNDQVRVDTGDPVERHRVATQDDSTSIGRALAGILRTLRR